MIKKLKNFFFQNKLPLLLLGVILLLSFLGYYFNFNTTFFNYLQKEISFLDFLETERKGVINLFTLIYTFIICIAIFGAWFWGGRVGLWTSTIIWNFEILFYMLYSNKWNYVIEHANLMLFIILLLLESPRDKRRKEFVQLQKEYEKNKKKELLLSIIEERKQKQKQIGDNKITEGKLNDLQQLYKKELDKVKILETHLSKEKKENKKLKVENQNLKSVNNHVKEQAPSNRRNKKLLIKLRESIFKKSNSQLKTEKKLGYLVLVDGYNLYYSLIDYLKSKNKSNEDITKLLWVDLFKLVEQYTDIKIEEIEELIFFSAKYQKEKQYPSIKKLKAFVDYHTKKYKSKFNYKYGYFQENDKKTEEKQTDINLAIKMLDGVLISGYEKIVLISNDNDFAPCVKYIIDKRKTKVLRLAPYKITPFTMTNGDDHYQKLRDHQDYKNYIQVASINDINNIEKIEKCCFAKKVDTEIVGIESSRLKKYKNNLGESNK